MNQAEYAITLGNHDAQANLNRTEIVELDMTHPFRYWKGDTKRERRKERNWWEIKITHTRTCMYELLIF